MSLTQKTLANAMKKLLGYLNHTGEPVTEDTIHSTILSDKDGFGASNSKNIYYGSVRWTLWRSDSKLKNKKFPSGWMDMSVKDVAAKLLLLLCLFLSLNGTAQQKPVRLQLGTVQTALKQGALNFGFSYLRNLDSIWKNKIDYFIPSNRGFLLVTPDINIQNGTSDAFSSVVMKVSALYTAFKTTYTADSVAIPDLGKTFHTVPISLGVETDAGFKTLNGIFEAGYVPYFKNNPVKFGFFVQSGYKFRLDSLGLFGGKRYEGREKNKSFLFRLKSSLAVNTPQVNIISGFKVSLVGFGEGWYDVVNTVYYYRLTGAFRVFLTQATYFDLKYEKGSGEPLFNQGSQFGANLVLLF